MPMSNHAANNVAQIQLLREVLGLAQQPGQEAPDAADDWDGSDPKDVEQLNLSPDASQPVHSWT